MMLSTENRARERHFCSIPIWISIYTLGERNRKARALSYSVNGLCARTDFSLNPGSIVLIRIGYDLMVSGDNCPPTGLPSIVSAKVKSCGKIEDLISPYL